MAGEGEDVLFLHGTSGHLEAFTRNIVPHVEAGFRCHAIDMLGHGYTDKPDYDYEIPRYVDHVLAYLDAAGIERAHLVGESLGGWVSAWLASEHPERVITLQLVAAGGTKANPEVMERIRTSTLQAVEHDDPAVTRQRLELLMHHIDGNVTDELVDVRHRIYHTPEFRRTSTTCCACRTWRSASATCLRPDRLAQLADIPTLIIWGHENPFGDVPEAQRDARGHPRLPPRAVSRVRALAAVRAPRPLQPDVDRVPARAADRRGDDMPNGPGAGRLQELGARARDRPRSRSGRRSSREQIDATLREYYRPLDALSDEQPAAVRFPRSPGFRPAPDDNPFNAWYWRTEIRGAAGRAARRAHHRGEGQRGRRRACR